ncbi:MAG: ATP-binding cassette domain-containing protein, partial [Corynebacterium flavescens]|nr:ATP-binding cassette domain-containing protein [Corynebacterium flavescens]
MIVTNDFEVRVGARTLLDAPGQLLRVQPGDRIGLVGRNGAGKTTTMRILAGETEPYGGSVTRSGSIGYLPQDSREGNIDQTARERVLSARGLDTIKRSMLKQQDLMENAEDDAKRDKAIAKYSRLEEKFETLGGYEADADCAQICDNLGLPQRVLDQSLKTLSGGQRRRVELAQILFAATEGSGKSQTTL